MARPLGSGPIHVYLGFGPPAAIPPLAAYPVIAGAPAVVGASAAVYYGTTRDGPSVTEENAFYPVMNDITGPKQSMDEGFAGREDAISLVMSSWTQSVDNQLEHFLDPSDARNSRGTDALSDLGSLILSEGRAVGLWMLKAGSLKAANVAAGLPRGRYYPTCIMVGPNQLVEGNKENLRVRVFKAKKNVWALSQAALPLFSEDVRAFSAGMLNGTAATFG